MAAKRRAAKKTAKKTGKRKITKAHLAKMQAGRRKWLAAGGKAKKRRKTAKRAKTTAKKRGSGKTSKRVAKRRTTKRTAKRATAKKTTAKRHPAKKRAAKKGRPAHAGHHHRPKAGKPGEHKCAHCGEMIAGVPTSVHTPGKPSKHYHPRHAKHHGAKKKA